MTATVEIPEIVFEREAVDIIGSGDAGRLGSIRPLDAWQGRLSPMHAKTLIANVATSSYGKESAKNPEVLFGRLMNAKPVPHGEPLEMVPVPDFDYKHVRWLPLRGASLRHHMHMLEHPELEHYWGERAVASGRQQHPCHLFLIEMPLFLRAQLFRHETFPHLTEANVAPEQGQSKNEMSRRWTTDKSAAFTFAFDDSENEESPIAEFHAYCLREYYRRLNAGWKPERARGAIPQEAMTKFWWGGYDRDILAGPKIQRTDAHAQEDLRMFVQWIVDYLEGRT